MSIQHMQTVFDAGQLTAPQKAVLLSYCNFTDAHGYCWPGVERIADMTGLSVSGVKKIRQQLIEAKLLTTVSRGKKGGGRKTNGSRINVKRLQKMKLPPREYDDNVMAGLGFEEDNEVEVPEAKVPEGYTNGSPEAPQRYLGGTIEGTSGSPYPSVDPSGDPSMHPSSSSVTVVETTPPVAAQASAKKMRNEESAEEIIKARLAEDQCTDAEAAAVAKNINQQGGTHGERIRSLPWWVTRRDIHTLRDDLAHVRDPGAYLRGINRTAGHQPYRNPSDQSVYDAPLLPPVSRRQQETDGLFDRAMARSRAREQRMGPVRGGARSPLPTHEQWDAGEVVVDL